MQLDHKIESLGAIELILKLCQAWQRLQELQAKAPHFDHSPRHLLLRAAWNLKAGVVFSILTLTASQLSNFCKELANIRDIL